MIITDANYIQNPLVSVFVITYNQEKTIAQTIESILMQKGNFTLELVIGEDCSTDKTAEVCKEYQKKYPEKIKLLLQDTNQGLVKNYIDTLKLCKGKYIGVCAGDDYWCDEYKIRKQLDFFAQNPDFGVVTTGGYKLYVKSNKLVEGIAPLNPVKNGNVFDLTWRGGVYAMPLTLLFRAELLNFINFDDFIERKFFVEDVPMQAIMAHNTKFGHIPDLCVVYRVYNSSLTFTNFNSASYIAYHEGLVAIRRYLYELYPNEVEFSENWAYDYIVYRRFQKAIFNFDYKNAKKQLYLLKEPREKENRAKRLTSNIVGFYIFCIVKKIRLKKFMKG